VALIQASKITDIPETIDLKPGDLLELLDNRRENRTTKKYFEVVKKIGEGGFAKVFSIKRKSKIFAMKVLDLSQKQPSEWRFLIDRYKESLRVKELRHPNIMKHYLDGQINGNPYLVMDYCPNGNARTNLHYLESDHKVITFFMQVLAGLKKLHQEGIIHRDIKPENILFDDHLNAVITDFDISTVKEEDSKSITSWLRWLKLEKNEVWGTISYAPPEQIDPFKNKKYLGPAMDIFSLGATMYEQMSNGALAYPVVSEQIDVKERIKEMEHVKYVPLQDLCNYTPDLCKIIDTCLELALSERYATVDDVEKAVERDLPCAFYGIHGIYLRPSSSEEKNKPIYFKDKLPSLGVLRIGRDEHSDIVVPDVYKNISRHHATIEIVNGNLHLRDGQFRNGKWHNSSNGTSVENVDLYKEQSIQIEHGCKIQLGGTEFKLFKSTAS
jgi:serine/threonine protein kinase